MVQVSISRCVYTLYGYHDIVVKSVLYWGQVVQYNTVPVYINVLLPATGVVQYITVPVYIHVLLPGRL
jgi:hypothetical protein